MLEINLKKDFKAAEKMLGNLAKQVPFATSVAINKTLADVQKVERAAIKRELDKPRPATVKGIRTKRSTKRSLSGQVFIIPHIAKFLIYQIEGIKRLPKNKSEAVPFNLKLNKYGNIAGRRSGKINKLIAKKNNFVATIKGISGVWQRINKGRKVKLLIAFEQSVNYSKKFMFYQHAQRTINRRWSQHFDKAIALAISTAK